MATDPDTFYVGQLVQLPAISGGNGGADKHPGIITEITDPNPAGGGVKVNVRTFTNSTGLSLGVVDALFCLYEDEARDQGFGGLLNNVPKGCWPLDVG